MTKRLVLEWLDIEEEGGLGLKVDVRDMLDLRWVKGRGPIAYGN